MKNVKSIIVACLAIVALTASIATATPMKSNTSASDISALAGPSDATEPEPTPAAAADSGEERVIGDESGEEGITSVDGDDSGSYSVSMSTVHDANNGSKACRAVIYFVCRTKDGHNWCVKATKWICD